MHKPTIKIAAGLVLCLSGIAATSAAQAPLDQQIRAQRSALSIENGKLTGPGAVKLYEAIDGKQFVLIGEDHGIREIADFSASYFEALAAQGYTTLALENGPAVGMAMQQALRTPDPQAALAAFNRSYPFAMAFYDLGPEADFLARVARAAGPKFKLLGFDQELMGASTYLLAQIAREPINPKARDLLAALQAQDAGFYRQAAASGNPGQLFMMAARADDLTALRNALGGAREKKALALLDSLIESRSIYDKNMTGKGYASNLQRAALMKRVLAGQLAGAPEQKMLIKVGAYHAFRGYNVLGSREIGNYLAEHADGNGKQSLHILVLSPAGQQSRFAGIGRAPASTPIEPIGVDAELAGVLPLYAAAAQEQGWSLYDLRPLRQKSQSMANSKFNSLVLGFDFALVIPVASAAAPLP